MRAACSHEERTLQGQLPGNTVIQYDKNVISHGPCIIEAGSSFHAECHFNFMGEPRTDCRPLRWPILSAPGLLKALCLMPHGWGAASFTIPYSRIFLFSMYVL
jgi:hypothetical protein